MNFRDRDLQHHLIATTHINRIDHRPEVCAAGLLAEKPGRDIVGHLGLAGRIRRTAENDGVLNGPGGDFGVWQSGAQKLLQLADIAADRDLNFRDAVSLPVHRVDRCLTQGRSDQIKLGGGPNHRAHDLGVADENLCGFARQIKDDGSTRTQIDGSRRYIRCRLGLWRLRRLNAHHRDARETKTHEGGAERA